MSPGPLSPEDRRAVDAIADELRSKGQFVLQLDAHDLDGIARIRALGRRAARELGWKVRTVQTDSADGPDHNVAVFVVVIESNPLHQQLMKARGDKALRKAFESWDLGGSGG